MTFGGTLLVILFSFIVFDLLWGWAVVVAVAITAVMVAIANTVAATIQISNIFTISS